MHFLNEAFETPASQELSEQIVAAVFSGCYNLSSLELVLERVGMPGADSPLVLEIVDMAAMDATFNVTRRTRRFSPDRSWSLSFAIASLSATRSDFSGSRTTQLVTSKDKM
jgi:hypothetical protein